MSTDRGKVRSIRGYRRLIDQTIRQVLDGKLSAREGAIRVNLFKAGADLLLSENLLHAAGAVDQEAQLHELGENGGVEIDFAESPKVAGVKTVHTKQGFSPKGQTCETTVKAVYEVPHDATGVPALKAPVYEEDESE